MTYSAEINVDPNDSDAHPCPDCGKMLPAGRKYCNDKCGMGWRRLEAKNNGVKYERGEPGVRRRAHTLGYNVEKIAEKYRNRNRVYRGYSYIIQEGEK